MGEASSPAVAQAAVAWDTRIARARLLAARSTASAILTFYGDLAEFQRRLAADAGRLRVGAADVRHDAAARAIAPLLRWLRERAPAPLAQAAAQAEGVSTERWSVLLRRRLATGDGDGLDSATAFIIEAALQPFAAGVVGSGPGQPAARCPRCGSHPVVGALREEGQGARRVLICALCFSEWNYVRVQCPACEERRFDALPVYTADSVAHVRIDACDQCRAYVKTVDLTKEGLAIPVVDDLATVPLDLWAREHGYRRLYPNLLRL